ncbi:pleiotropic regulatory protein RsmS [Oceanimonas pelagia]|uniref:Pleiotropic regulatory protein RsmS n=1 Tax=Oceanimonas pelagia TaxID=3028314 RepID=A0AA50Q8M9_9GAMM|nr:pleiotropic regulatory protein RsmS [Oceanimonas pelagia]WMC12010.1 pleiotropic regulatory protein RsmS [Oceanimonas pelagia]
MNLNDAPAHIQLAVDLIELLEINEVRPEVALAALAIVTRDFEHKLAEQHDDSDAG